MSRPRWPNAPHAIPSSPADRESDINEKVDLDLEAGTAAIWLLDPHLRTITLIRPDAPPRLVAEPDTLDAEPYLPGLVTPVARLFGARP